MKFDRVLFLDNLDDALAIAYEAETLGFDGLWTTETQHHPLFPLVLTAARTNHIELGTAIMVAFARSPMDLAYQAWDLAQLSQGRFILGLGTQVKPHIERRFAMRWGPPVPKLREYVQALRHIWHSWQTGERLNFRGDFYRITLMSPFFNPGPIDHPDIPIYLAGVNEGLCRLAGELADGFHLHPFHSLRYLQEQAIPWIEAGAREAGRSLADITLSTAVFVITGKDEEAMQRSRNDVRQQIAFYASTPTYRTIMAIHGWEEIAAELSRLAAQQKWDDMPHLITDNMLTHFAVEAPPEHLADAVQARYAGLLDRISYYAPCIPDADEAFWRDAVDRFR